MKQYQVNNAYETLRMMAAYKLPAKASYQLWSLSKALEPARTFALEEQKKFLEHYHGTVDAQGVARFPTKDEEDGFVRDMTDLANADIDVAFTPVRLADDILDGVRLSMDDIARLEGFVTFSDKEA